MKEQQVHNEERRPDAQGADREPQHMVEQPNPTVPRVSGIPPESCVHCYGVGARLVSDNNRAEWIPCWDCEPAGAEPNLFDVYLAVADDGHPGRNRKDLYDELGRRGVRTDRMEEMLDEALVSGMFVKLPGGRVILDAEDSGERPTINVAGRELHELCDDGLAAIIRANDPPNVYLHGSELVRAITHQDDGTPSLSPLIRASLRDRLSRVAMWVRDAKGGPTTVHPPNEVVDNILARDEYPLPVVHRIVSAPVFGRDGTVSTLPGYSAASRTIYMPSDGMGEVRQGCMTVPEALRLIEDELLHDFPFVTLADRAAATGLLLLPFVRELISGPTPLHLIDASSPGTGKGLLVDALLIPALGSVPLTSLPRDEDEWRKKITSTLRTGPSAVVLDNVRGKLDSGVLAMALTTDVWEDRILGHSHVGRFPIRNAWAATLNNASLSTELVRRSVRIRMDTGVERPWLRASSDFKHPDLRGWVHENRACVVEAALTLVAAWVDAGRPPGKGALGSFESWASVIGGILVHAGVDDFLGNLGDLYEEADEESSEWAEFTRVWLEMGLSLLTAKQLADLCIPGSPLREALPTELAACHVNDLAQRMTYALRSQKDNVFDGRKLVKIRGRHSHWAVVSA